MSQGVIIFLRSDRLGLSTAPAYPVYSHLTSELFSLRTLLTHTHICALKPKYTQPHIQGYLKPCHRWEMDVGILESSIIAAVTDDGIPLFCCCFFFTSSFGLNLMCLSENDKVGGLAVSACALSRRVMVLKWEMGGQVFGCNYFSIPFSLLFLMIALQSLSKIG